MNKKEGETEKGYRKILHVEAHLNLNTETFSVIPLVIRLCIMASCYKCFQAHTAFAGYCLSRLSAQNQCSHSSESICELIVSRNLST